MKTTTGDSLMVTSDFTLDHTAFTVDGGRHTVANLPAINGGIVSTGEVRGVGHSHSPFFNCSNQSFHQTPTHQPA